MLRAAGKEAEASMLSRKTSPKLLLERITPKRYLSSLLANTIQLARKPCLLLL